MFISFAWTSKAFINNCKVVTRRYWKDNHAKKFKKGMIVEAYDKLPYKGGNKIGEIRLTNNPYQQRTGMMTIKDFYLEGLHWMYINNIKIHGEDAKQFFDKWREKNDLVWVIEFEKIK